MLDICNTVVTGTIFIIIILKAQSYNFISESKSFYINIYKKNLKDTMTSKTFIVTGASRGIGRSVSLSLVTNFENNVLAIARSKDDLINLKQHVEVDLNLKDKLEIVVGDVTEEKVIDEAINKCLNKWKRIDGVVANAG